MIDYFIYEDKVIHRNFGEDKCSNDKKLKHVLFTFMNCHLYFSYKQNVAKEKKHSYLNKRTPRVFKFNKYIYNYIGVVNFFIFTIKYHEII